MADRSATRPAAQDVLRCPFCGGLLEVQPGGEQAAEEDRLLTGVLGCACCAYPVVAGIPYLRAGRVARAALELVDAGKVEEALFALLGLEGARWERFEALRGGGGQCSFRQVLEIFSPNPEGVCFLHRFSDPTFLVSDALARALGADARCTRSRLLDLCGGVGHLTRTLCGLSSGGEVWLADIEFWKLWLARQFIAPQCHAVCCDAAQPLPFARGGFSLVVCADALHYVWPRRLAVSEMTRLAGREGVVAVTGTHNALCENASAGLPLKPEAWRALFEEVPARLFAESVVLDAVLGGGPIPLGREFTDGELAAEPAIIAIASGLEGLFRDRVPSESAEAPCHAVLNPLYRREESDLGNEWKLEYPSAAYAEEFAGCRRYLPERLALTEGQLRDLERGEVTEATRELAGRRVVLDLPENYL
ncbi:MAG TPA: class I SAM-dependent methyltransferase [Methylomirabilota bacterium]|nr:class I SAM-dependent methyltransferase [Methylomirabilota bacterium]